MPIQADIAYPKIFMVAAARSTAKGVMDNVISRFAIAGKVTVLDAGNCFDSYAIAHLVREQNLDPRFALANIQIARAFTCLQTLALLHVTPVDADPKVVLDLLSTFHDDGISLAERGHLFEQVMDRLRHLSQSAPVFVSVKLESSGLAEEQAWFNMLQEAAGNILFLKGQAITPLSERLF